MVHAASGEHVLCAVYLLAAVVIMSWMIQPDKAVLVLQPVQCSAVLLFTQRHVKAVGAQCSRFVCGLM